MTVERRMNPDPRIDELIGAVDCELQMLAGSLKKAKGE
jgi:hypothetical protein